MNNYHELAQHLLRQGYMPDSDNLGRWIQLNHRKVLHAVIGERDHTSGVIQDRLVDLYLAEGMENIAYALKDLHNAIEREEWAVECALRDEMERILCFEDEMKQLANEIELTEKAAA